MLSFRIFYKRRAIFYGSTQRETFEHASDEALLTHTDVIYVDYCRALGQTDNRIRILHVHCSNLLERVISISVTSTDDWNCSAVHKICKRMLD